MNVSLLLVTSSKYLFCVFPVKQHYIWVYIDVTKQENRFLCFIRKE